ncbi:MAG: hypothetical protein ACRYFV_12350 [Janthinobacterium lividum]
MAFVVITGTGADFNMIVTLKLHMEVFGSSLREACEDLDPVYFATKWPVEFEVDNTGKAAHFVYLAHQVGVMCHLRSGFYE